MESLKFCRQANVAENVPARVVDVKSSIDYIHSDYHINNWAPKPVQKQKKNKCFNKRVKNMYKSLVAYCNKIKNVKKSNSSISDVGMTSLTSPVNRYSQIKIAIDYCKQSCNFTAKGLSSQTEGLPELRTSGRSQRIVENQVKNQRPINGELDTHVTVLKSQVNDLLMKLDDKSHQCEELEETCFELKLIVESIPRKYFTLALLDRILQNDDAITKETATITKQPEGFLKKQVLKSKNSSLLDRILQHDDAIMKETDISLKKSDDFLKKLLMKSKNSNFLDRIAQRGVGMRKETTTTTKQSDGLLKKLFVKIKRGSIRKPVSSNSSPKDHIGRD